MGEFLQLIAPEEFLLKLNESVTVGPKGTEIVPFTAGLGRIVAADVTSKVDLPAFNRSTVDGFAVRSADTAGASETLPGYLRVAGEVRMGEVAEVPLHPGEAIKIATGGMLAEGADAVMMVEYTEYLDGSTIEFIRAVAVGENIVRRGEDISAGTVLFQRGHKLRPQDIGALAGLGITEVTVYRIPEVALLSTGDELIAPEEEPAPGQVRDINTYSIGTFLKQAGCRVRELGIIEDSYEQLRTAVETNLDADLILISGGSSVGVKDLTVDVLNSFGEPGVIVHGVAIKPGKPTILAVVQGVPVIGLPGHPSSAWNITTVLVQPILRVLTGETEAASLAGGKGAGVRVKVQAVLSRNLVSDRGKAEYVPVKLQVDPEHGWLAVPVLGKSSLITTLARADGYIRIDTFAEGLNQGELVDVVLY